MPGSSLPSIFTDVSVFKVTAPGNSHNFNIIGISTTHQILAASSCLTKDGEAIFALSTSHGSVLLVKLPPHGIQGRCWFWCSSVGILIASWSLIGSSVVLDFTPFCYKWSESCFQIHHSCHVWHMSDISDCGFSLAETGGGWVWRRFHLSVLGPSSLLCVYKGGHTKNSRDNSYLFDI